MKMLAKPNVDLIFSFQANEKEARALDALVGYDFDSFLKVFKTHLGAHYMEGYEETLRDIFKMLRSELPPALASLDQARKVMTK